tara:strand:+ start:2450 stop:2818 length:369 start_codon:yes stop_codon:yes gene_type:complete
MMKDVYLFSYLNLIKLIGTEISIGIIIKTKVSKEEPLDVANILSNILEEELKKVREESFKPVMELFDKYNISPENRLKILVESHIETIEHFKKKGQIMEDTYLISVTMKNIENFKNQNKEKT